VDASELLSVFLRGTLGARGRKRARRARQFVTGNKGFLTTSTLLTAAGLAWGVYDSLKATSAGPAVAPGGAVGPAAPQTLGAAPENFARVSPSSTPGGNLPPLARAATNPLPHDVLRLVRLAVSAARADGTLSDDERALIVQHARDAGIEHDVESELIAPRPVADIVRGVDELQQRQDLYVLGFAIVRADESVSGAERIYLAQLAHQLRLDPGVVATLEQTTAAQIDASEGEQQ